MKPVGLALVWVGYTLAYFGYCSLRGPGVGLLDLVVPGRTVDVGGGLLAGGLAQPAGLGPNTPGGGPGGSTVTTDPNGKVTNVIPGPGDTNNLSPGGVYG